MSAVPAVSVPLVSLAKPNRSVTYIARIGLLLCMLAVAFSQNTRLVVAAPPTYTIAGVVFDDANASGTQDTGEPSLRDVTVAAFTANEQVTTTTSATGAYTLTVTTPKARVEFTHFPTGYTSSVFGLGSGTSVQFVDAPATNVNLGLINPSQYCQNNPRLITSCFVFGDNVNGLDKAQTTVRSFPYLASGADQTLQASETRALQTGAVYGVAYQRTTRTAFVSAYVKRAASFGTGTGQPLSDGSGTIYALQIGSNTAAPFADLDVLMNSDVTGANPHTDYNPDAPDFDAGAYDAVGKMALGEMEMGEDDATLWVVNLKDRSLYKLPVGYTATAPDSAHIARYPIPSPTCNNGQARPFAVKPHNGALFVGGVCTAENGGSAADLSAYVYTFDIANEMWSTTPVLQFALNYERTCTDVFPTYNTVCRNTLQAQQREQESVAVKGSLAKWQPWQSSIDETFAAGFDEGYVTQPQPMLTSIEFYGDDMVLGLRDRFADQVGYLDPGPFGSYFRNPADPTDEHLYDLKVVPAGDILRAAPGATGTWHIEDNATGETFAASSGANNGQGPGGGEFYTGDVSVINNKVVHDESMLGALLQVPGHTDIVGTVMDPVHFFSGGVAWLSNLDGTRQRSYEVYEPEARGSYRKTNGMGDIEALCDAAPIEIGNRVWLDNDRDGTQDANEPPIANVMVTLRDADNHVLTTTTDANGQYIFSSLISDTTGTPSPSRAYNIAWLTFGRAYTVSIALEQRALADYIPTTPNADPTPNGDARDSDGIRVNDTVVNTLQTGGPGANDHTHDFGFVKPLVSPVSYAPSLAITKLVNNNDANTTPGITVSVGSVVTWTYLITNTGDISLTNVVVNDDKEGNICTFAVLQPNESQTCNKTGIAVAGQYKNTGIVTATNAQLISETVTAQDVAHYFGGAPQLVISKQGKPSSGDIVNLGDKITYTILLTNTGSYTATNVSIRDVVPLGTEYVAGTAVPAPISTNPMVWNVGTLAPNQSTAVSFAVRVASTLSITAIINRANALIGQTVVVTSNAVVNVLPQQLVSLAGFDVMREGERVRVRWQTASELNTFGFVVYRAEQNDFEKASAVHEDLVFAKGASTYDVLDSGANPNKTYFYWLFELETTGKRHIYGPTPLQALVAAPQPVAVAAPAIWVDVPVANAVARPDEKILGTPSQAAQNVVAVNAELVPPAQPIPVMPNTILVVASSSQTELPLPKPAQQAQAQPQINVVAPKISQHPQPVVATAPQTTAPFQTQQETVTVVVNAPTTPAQPHNVSQPVNPLRQALLVFGALAVFAMFMVAVFGVAIVCLVRAHQYR